MNIKTITLAAGDIVPALGQGTWYLGDDPAKRAQEVSALRTGMGAGMRLIDTAEMYGDGRSEKLVGEAIAAAPREELFLVSKVLPENAGEKHIFQCCDATMNRMGVDYLDLYLLHWRGSVPLAETVRCLEQLKELGKIKNWGVSNFDIGDMEELWRIPGGRNCQVNQVLYHMGSRGIEYSLLPWMREHRVALMAYCPLAQGGALRRGLLTDPAVLAVAETHRPPGSHPGKRRGQRPALRRGGPGPHRPAICAPHPQNAAGRTVISQQKPLPGLCRGAAFLSGYFTLQLQQYLA